MYTDEKSSVVSSQTSSQCGSHAAERSGVIYCDDLFANSNTDEAVVVLLTRSG